MLILLVASLIAILTTIGIFLSLFWESIRFFAMVPPQDFLLGTHWSPQLIDPNNPGKSLGAVPLFWGTFFIGAVIAMLVAIPFGLMSAIYLTQYAAPRAPLDEADARDPRRRADGGLWLFRRADRGAGGARPGGASGHALRLGRARWPPAW